MFISIVGFAQDNNRLEGKWILIQFKNVKTGEVEEAVSEYSMFTFRDSANMVMFGVYPSCNGFTGRYVIHDSNKISVKRIMAGTRVSCPLEQEVLKAMDSSSSYRRIDSTLYIYYNSNKEAMVFVSSSSHYQLPENMRVYLIAGIMPRFPGYLNRYIADSIRIPKDSTGEKISGTVYLNFIVEKDGSLSNIKVVRSVCPSLDSEAERLVSGMPKWTPGKQDGVPVRVNTTLPVHFR
jgi:protein TonB